MQGLKATKPLACASTMGRMYSSRTLERRPARMRRRSITASRSSSTCTQMTMKSNQLLHYTETSSSTCTGTTSKKSQAHPSQAAANSQGRYARQSCTRSTTCRQQQPGKQQAAAGRRVRSAATMRWQQLGAKMPPCQLWANGGKGKCTVVRAHLGHIVQVGHIDALPGLPVLAGRLGCSHTTGGVRGASEEVTQMQDRRRHSGQSWIRSGGRWHFGVQTRPARSSIVSAHCWYGG